MNGCAESKTEIPMPRTPFGMTSLVLALAILQTGACSDSGSGRQHGDGGPDGALGDGQALQDGTGSQGDADTADASAPQSDCWNHIPELGEVAFWVSPDGDDQQSGSQDQPFATIHRAAEAVRSLLSSAPPDSDVTVVLRKGSYPIEETWQLGPEDSGPSDQVRVVWRSYPGENVVLTGARAIQSDWFSAVPSDDPLFDRIPDQVRSRVLVAALADHGITDYGTLQHRGSSSSHHWGTELLVNGRPAELAGWPNRGQSDPLDETRPALVKGDIFGADGTQFESIGTQASGNANDGYPNYRATVNGTTYYLYHCTWSYNESLPRYWWVSEADPRTNPKCWPSDITAWGASGTDPIPVLTRFAGSAQEAIQAYNRPEDFALNGLAWFPKAYSNTEFQLPGTRWHRWLSAEDPWFFGLFRHLWADATLPGTIDDQGRVTLAEAPTYGMDDMHPFRVINLVEELDAPGEYHLDRSTGRLYYLPQSDLAGSNLAVTQFDGPLLSLDGTAHVAFEGIQFWGSRGHLVEATDVTDVVFGRCAFLAAAGSAFRLTGTKSGLSCCLVRDSGAYAIRIQGGHRATLERGDSFVRDCDIGFFGRLDRAHGSGILVNGCGQIVEHNKIHDAPDDAILFSGNEHLFAYNELTRLDLEVSDAGAIYTGRDWGYRGNRIEYNWIHHVGGAFHGVHGVYLDDASSGISVFGNIIQNIRGAGTMSGGGRDNHFENNILVHIEGAAHSTDRRARTSNHDFDNNVPDSWNLLGRLHFNAPSYEWGTELAYKENPWASAYPDLAAIPDDWNQIQDSHWQDPEGCIFSRNVIYDSEGFIAQGTWGGENALDSYADVSDNLQDEDPMFVDEDNGDLNLKTDSQALAIPGFQPIPFDQIGPR